MRTPAITVLLSLVTTAALAQEPRTNPPGVEAVGHKHLVVDHARLSAERPRVPNDGALAALRAYQAPGIGPQVKRTVFGYLPYWSYKAGEPYVPLRWDMLTHLAWFAAEMDASGDITDKHGWGGATTAAMVADAHAHGVDVVVTITNFVGSEIDTIVGSAANRQRAIDNCLDLMDEHDADGIDIDFEFVPSSAKANFVTFMKDLKNAVKAKQPNGKDGHVTLAGPAIDWWGSYDYDQLLAGTDGIMIMAYGYHYGGGNPGPAATLFSGNVWNAKFSIEWTIEDYFKYGCAVAVDPVPSWCGSGIVTANRHKIILGLPWYGHAWRVANEDVPGTALANGTSVFYYDAKPQMVANGREWEPVSMSSYYHRTVSGNLQQVWVDDAVAFEARVAYADEMDIGGIGIWALGYEGAGPEMWTAIETPLGVDPTEPDVAPEVSPEPVAEVSPEPVAEPAPEPTIETGPEPVAEPAPEPDPTTAPDTSVAVSDSGVNVLDPQRGVSSRNIAAEEGCAAGVDAPWMIALLFVGAAWSSRRRPLR